MVVIKRLWQPEKILEQTMQAGGMEQVLTAHHMGDALMRIVDHDRKVIAGGNILARQDDVAPRRRIGQNHAGLPARTCGDKSWWDYVCRESHSLPLQPHTGGLPTTATSSISWAFQWCTMARFGIVECELGHCRD